MRLRATALVLGLLAPARAAGEWHELPVPGGCEALGRAVGLETPDCWRAVIDVARRVYTTSEGAALRPALLAQLRGANPRESGTAPLPLPPAKWERSVFRRPVPPGRLLLALLSGRRASLLYRGLMAVDPETLAFLGERPDLLSSLHRDHALVFGRFSAGFSVRDGRVAVPGGLEAIELWEALVGEPAAKPEAFLLALLGRSEGRLAFFYDTLARLEPAQRSFALGPALDPDRRLDRFRALWALFAREEPWWDESLSKRVRPEADAARVLLEARVTSDGALAPPADRALWERVFDDEAPAPGPDAAPEGEPADAAWLVEKLAAPPPARALARLAAVSFGQRVLAEAEPGPDLEVSLRGALRYPALLWTLERIGATQPALLASATRRAGQLSGPRTGSGAATAIAQFQGALALLDRARFVRALDEGEARALAASLIAVEPLGSLSYEGRIARWLDRELLPALAPDGSVEEALERGLAGSRPPEAVAWNGGDYVADLVGPLRARLNAVRGRMEGNSLEHVLDFCRSAAALAEARPHAWPGFMAALEDSARGLRALPGADPAVAAAAARSGLEAAGSPDAAGLRLCARPAITAGDALLAETLSTLAYAAQLAPADTVLLSGQLVRLHDFGLDAPSATERQRNPWRLPTEAPGRPWRVQGALLGLDAALAPHTQRRGYESEPPADAPRLGTDERAAFARGVALINPHALTDGEQDAVAAQVAGGRRRLDAAGTDPAALGTLAREAGLSPLRRNGLDWLARREPRAVATFFSLAELRALGGGWSEAWAVPAPPLGGLLPRALRLRPWEDIQGQTGQIAPRFPELALRVADALSARRLPAALAQPLLVLATQDLLDEARPASRDDGEAVARHARGLDASRIDGYLEALALEGFLRPAGATAAPRAHEP